MGQPGEGLSTPVESDKTLQIAEALLPILYQDLRRLARRARYRHRGQETLQTTALVHEAYLKLRSAEGFADREHFLRAAAIAMRHILVNNARDRVAAKRGGHATHVTLAGETLATDPQDDALLIDVNDALTALAAQDIRLARVVECRFFAGYTEAETAEALGVAERTVRRDWIKARTLLLHALRGTPAALAGLRPMEAPPDHVFHP